MENKQQHYLIKRNPDFTKDGVIVKRNNHRQGFSETKITKTKQLPSSSILNIGDIVYVAETGYGIYARGEVKELKNILTFETVNEILEYYKESKRKNASYWIDKMERLHEKKKESSNYVCRYHEYFIDQEIIDRTILLENK